jgi:hypothetical protein
VRSIFDDAFKTFAKISHKFDGFVDLELPLQEVSKAYEIFERQGARKIAFILPDGSTNV